MSKFSSIFKTLRKKIRSTLPSSVPVNIQFSSHKTITTLNGMSILHIAKANDIDISHYCGGVCSCGTCRVLIKEGAKSLSRMTGREEIVLGHSHAESGHRLACQAKVVGPNTVSVEIPRFF